MSANQSLVPNAVEALIRLIVAIEWEVPPIRDGVDVEERCAILMGCAREARAVVAANGGSVDG